ncbi:acyl carrier protein [Hepatocystis sp. ex Piliocolobus tephrosceles]|nr:acyl carrier protein [Hepatocystis sp. ex Piliocolobus tephrosceles]
MKIILLLLFSLCYVNAFKNFINDGLSFQRVNKNKKIYFRRKNSRNKFTQKYRTINSLNALDDDVKKVIAKQLSVDEDKIKNESNFIKDLGADSLDSVELIMALEEKFNVTISDQDALKITSVQEAIDFIEKNQKKDT